jgi:hypothetical protein
MKKIYRVKAIGVRKFIYNNEEFTAFRILSPIKSERNVKDFIKKCGEEIYINGKKVNIAGVGYKMPFISMGEMIEISTKIKKPKKKIVKITTITLAPTLKRRLKNG